MRTRKVGGADVLIRAHPVPTLTQPLLRDAYEKKPAMSKDEARDVLVRCLKVLFYRDCRSLNKVKYIRAVHYTDQGCLTVLVIWEPNTSPL